MGRMLCAVWMSHVTFSEPSVDGPERRFRRYRPWEHLTLTDGRRGYTT
jgi:hypothetical protein